MNPNGKHMPLFVYKPVRHNIRFIFEIVCLNAKRMAIIITIIHIFVAVFFSIKMQHLLFRICACCLFFFFFWFMFEIHWLKHIAPRKRNCKCLSKTSSLS